MIRVHGACFLSRLEMRRITDDQEAKVQRLLRSAGWYPGRRVPELVDAWSHDLAASNFEVFPVAREALLEFGGLRVPAEGTGVTLAPTSFWLDPTLALGEDERFERMRDAVGSRLCPLGDKDNGNSFLAMDESGRVYSVADWCVLTGENMSDAIRAMIVGLEGRRMV